MVDTVAEQTIDEKESHEDGIDAPTPVLDALAAHNRSRHEARMLGHVDAKSRILRSIKKLEMDAGAPEEVINQIKQEIVEADDQDAFVSDLSTVLNEIKDPVQQKIAILDVYGRMQRMNAKKLA